ncbi:opioid-binding cell adhesion molecule isoform X4 [Paramuricea clavata]|uniref:Opioid-binding cell adhesion molecule isoform X4 n=1 Tax=Paramuricea clavata TaxID=317549 RepID=A0A6S7GEC6_PARCT|nr:opioid-binding cell adhesion molecule isoform X4 [Paramuricea clavata]
MVKMSWFVFIYGLLFSLNFISYECEGRIILPPDGTNRLTILPGESDSIIWNFDDDISAVASRSWSFTSSDGLRKGILGAISWNSQPVMQKKILPRISITNPATLALNNVNQSYDGTYTFSLASTDTDKSDVRVFIANAPNVTFSCSSAVTVNEGDNFTCVCRGEGGNPPADVTWYKDGTQIGGTGKEKKTLTLSDVSRTNRGTYECEARSHTDDRFADKKSIEVEVNYPPERTRLNYDPKSLTITCDGGKARPPARFEIFFNETKLVMNETKLAMNETKLAMNETKLAMNETKLLAMNETKLAMRGKTYTIPERNSIYSGNYRCDAINKLGRRSSSSEYILPGVPPTTRPPTTSTTQGNQTVKPKDTSIAENECGNYFASGFLNVKGEATGSKVDFESCGTVVTLVSGFILGILFSYIVRCSYRRWFRNGTTERNLEPKITETDTTYQELDLSKMNKEDNYQSLRVNAASYNAGNQAGNDDNSTYTELTDKTRDVEDVYQSLT